MDRNRCPDTVTCIWNVGARVTSSSFPGWITCPFYWGQAEHHKYGCFSTWSITIPVLSPDQEVNASWIKPMVRPSVRFIHNCRRQTGIYMFVDNVIPSYSWWPFTKIFTSLQTTFSRSWRAQQFRILHKRPQDRCFKLLASTRIASCKHLSGKDTVKNCKIDEKWIHAIFFLSPAFLLSVERRRGKSPDAIFDCWERIPAKGSWWESWQWFLARDLFFDQARENGSLVVRQPLGALPHSSRQDWLRKILLWYVFPLYNCDIQKYSSEKRMLLKYLPWIRWIPLIIKEEAFKSNHCALAYL